MKYEKRPQNKAFYGHRDTYSGKVFCIKANVLLEEKLLSLTNEIHEALLTLMEIAIKEMRVDDAAYIAGVDEQAAKIFDLWEYNSYVAHFLLYSALKDRTKCLKVVVPMLRSLTKKWEVNQSPLYQHMKTKEVDQDFGKTLQKHLLQSISEDEETSFLKESPELKDILREVGERSF